jgi:hypothetical protein
LSKTCSNKFILIQRLQTLFLIIAVILNTGVFFSPVYRHAMNDPAGWVGLGFASLLTAASLLGIISVFLYNNRINQLRWVKLATLLQIAVFGFAGGILFSLGGFGTFLWKEVISTGIILLSLICFWQAGRLIKKDEELVKSMDRIR